MVFFAEWVTKEIRESGNTAGIIREFLLCLLYMYAVLELLVVFA